MKTATVRRVSAPVPLTGETADTVWARADRTRIDNFLWTEPDRQPQAVVRLLYDETAIYLQYTVEDRHIHATTDSLNGPVWEDSCVEFFATPASISRERYFNFEINCTGTFHFGYGSDRNGRTLVDRDAAADVRATSSVDGRTKQPHPTDSSWWVAVELPFTVISTLTGTAVTPTTGTRWHGNFHRLGRRPEPFYAAWNPVETPEPDFHHPSAFGAIRFE